MEAKNMDMLTVSKGIKSEKDTLIIMVLVFACKAKLKHNRDKDFVRMRIVRQRILNFTIFFQS